MEDTIRGEIEKIIEHNYIKAVFQPIISLKDGTVLGNEALSRINCGSTISTTEELFHYASECNCLWDLELLCRVKSLEAAYIHMNPPYDRKLFINVNPKIMHDIKFQNGFTKEYLKRFDITPENIIFEITERDAIKDMESFKNVVEHYKNQQYKIAIDDAGAGYSGLNLISDIHPHYLKLDMKLIRDIDKDNLKYALVKSMIEFSRITGILLIAEGIETKEELKTLINMGIQFGQGYLIQKPDEIIKPIDSQLVRFIEDLNNKADHIQGTTLSKINIGDICTLTKAIDPETKVEQVFDEFHKDINIHGMCIVSEDRVRGIITRENLTLKLSGRYGFCLYQKKEIMTIMDREYLEVDYHIPISTVCCLAMQRENSKLYDMLVVTKEGKYYGTVTVKDLLQKTTEIDVMNARDQNPLSGLPGNIMIEQQLTQRIAGREECSVLYIDIDNFKAFNDLYGFENGDKVIKMLAMILLKYKEKDDFVGHIGGDDFIVITRNYDCEDLTHNIIQSFHHEAHSLYSPEDREQGYITASNRHGNIENYPLLSITIAVVSNHDNTYKNMYELSEELAHLKKKGKQIEGSVCVK